VPVGIFQSGWLQSGTSSSIAYNTTGPNDWIANGSNVGRSTTNSNTENSNSSVGQPGFWESIIPIWGSGRSAIDHFQRGNYWRGAGHTVLAVSDVFLIKSIGTAIGKGAWKFGGSNAWRATRNWLGKRGYAKAGQPVHHWAIHQATAKKYGLEAITNQPWNLKTFATQSMHMRAGHGTRFYGKQGYGLLGRLWFGTPWWPKFFLGSYGGRLVGGGK